MSTTSRFSRTGNHNRTNLLVVLLNTDRGIRPVYMTEIGKFPGPLGGIEEMLRGARAGAEKQGIEEFLAQFPKLPDGVPFRYFDWSLTEQPPTLLIAEFPTPGIIIAFCDPKGIGQLASVELFPVRALLQKHNDIKEFFASPDSRSEPIKVTEHDVFVSYTKADAALAQELHSQLTSAGVVAFLAERSITLSTRWEPAIRSALQRSRLLVVLITPNSLQSDWVIFEAGAAWALDVPIAAATQFVSPSQLPAALPNYQNHPYETDKQRTDFLAAVVDLVGKTRTSP